MTTTLLTVFVLSYFTGVLSQRVPGVGRNVWGKQKANLLFAMVPTMIMLLFSAARKNIGDTPYYIFTYQQHLLSGIVRPEIGGKAFLFEYLQYLLQKAGFEPHAVITLCSVMIIIPLMLMLRDYAFSFDTAIFLCFTTGLYTATMNGIRQYAATGILLLGTKYFFSPKKSDFFKYLIFVLIAYFIHSSALVLIPIYFICRQRAWSLPTFGIIIASLGALLMVSLFLPSFTSMLEGGSYDVYAHGWFTEGNEAGTNIFRILFNCLPMGLSIYFAKDIRNISPVCDILVNLSVVHAGIYLLAGYNWIFARFSFYTLPYMILLLSLIFGVCLKQQHNQALYVLLIGAFFVFFVKESYATLIQIYASNYFTPNNNVWFQFLQ